MYSLLFPIACRYTITQFTAIHFRSKKANASDKLCMHIPFLLSHVIPAQPGLHPPSHTPVILLHLLVTMQLLLHVFIQFLP